MRVEPEAMVGISQPGDGLILNLGPPLDQYLDEWTLASHTFTVTQEGVGLISFVFERVQ